MKKKKITKKLILNKVKITELNRNAQYQILGGTDPIPVETIAPKCRTIIATCMTCMPGCETNRKTCKIETCIVIIIGKG